MKQLLYTLFFLSLFYPNISSASHYSGTEMYYECLSPCVYRIHYKTFQDCSGGAITLPPNPVPSLIPNISFTGTGAVGCNVNPQIIGIWEFGHNIDVSTLCPSLLGSSACNGGTLYNGMTEVYYYADYDICQPNSVPCDEFEVTFLACCRNGAISSGAANQGIYLDIQIVRDTSSCNSSPVFNAPPVQTFCVGSPTVLDFSATDSDNDSLVFSLAAAQQAFNNPVSYSGGYSPLAPLGPSWDVALNSHTGLLSLTPNPGLPTVGVVRVDVEEYRNGVYLGKTSRDFQLSPSVLGCSTSTNVNLSGIQNLNNGSLINPNKIEACEGVTTTFEFTASDPAPNDSIDIMSNIHTVFPSAILTQTGVNPATYSVSITPGSQHSGNVYPFYLKATDNNCPFPTIDAFSFQIEVDNYCLTSQITTTNCNASIGAIDLTFNNGVPPIQYLWNTGDTTEDLTNIPSGIYSVSATDANGQMLLDTFFVNSNDLNISTTLVQPSCDGADGSIFPLVSGGTMPYSYSWSTGATTPSLGNLTDGGYTVYVWDSLNCFNHKANILDEPDSCYVEVSGKVYIDVNSNCAYDGTDYPITNAFMVISPGIVVFTDAAGDYTFQVDTGTVNVQYWNYQYQQYAFPPTQCSPGNIQTLTFNSYDDDTTGVDFPIDSIAIQDLAIAGIYNPKMVPGFSQTYNIAYSNPGTVTSNGTVEVVLDPNIVYESSTPAGTYDALNHTVSLAFNNLTSGQIRLFHVQTSIPTTLALGTPISSTFTVNPIVGDTAIWNNNFVKHDTIVSAYDPNDKQVIPRGIGSQGFIQTTDSLLTYNVRFQNTGNFPATFVIIEDQIDEDLDILSLIQGPSSHPYSLTIDENNKMTFTFNNINLPDSATDLAGSQGFVQFSIRQKPNLPIGTEIKNQASIIFDFNTPIITNQVTNTIFTYPEIAIIAGPDTLCEGEEIGAELTGLAMKPYTYNWQPLSQSFQTPDSVHSIEATDSDLYTVIVTDAFGFSDTASQYIDVVKNPVSDFAYQANSLIVDFTDNSSHADTWMWDFGDGNTSTDQNPQHTFGMDSIFEVILITSNECGDDTSKQAIEVSSGVSIDNDLFSRSVKIAPNPFSESVIISFDNPSLQPMELKLMDAKGRIIIHRKAEKTEQFIIQNHGLATGVYIIELIGDKRFVGKVMVR